MTAAESVTHGLTVMEGVFSESPRLPNSLRRYVRRPIGDFLASEDTGELFGAFHWQLFDPSAI